MALRRLLYAVLLVTLTATADDRRAEVNYMLHCQGCHLPEAAGFEGRVPPMKDFVGYFLHSTEGRSFLVRVPGVAQSALSDAEVAELMNWLLNAYSKPQLPESFRPFTAAEVETLRAHPLQDPQAARRQILASIATGLPALAAELGQPDEH